MSWLAVDGHCDDWQCYSLYYSLRYVGIEHYYVRCLAAWRQP